MLLSPEDWADIHAGVAEAMVGTALPIVFEQAVTADPIELDPLYREPVGGTTTWETFAEVSAWVRHYPEHERLMQLGLKTETEVLVFLPTAERRRWELANGVPLVIDERHRFTLEGQSYNVQMARFDTLASGDEGGTDAVGQYISGSSKPR